MSRTIRWMLVGLLVLAFLPAIPAKADAALPPGANENCAPFLNPAGGDVYLICVPAPWNGDVVVFTHGYVDPRLPVGIPYDQLALPDGTLLPKLVNSLGYAFIMTSYSRNGLAVVEGVQDTLNLITYFKSTHPSSRVYLIGASEGGLVTTLMTEKYPGVVKGGMATCGPIGDFTKQINYWGDFRVVYDYFFPGVLPPTAVSIPTTAIPLWSTYVDPNAPIPVQVQGPLQALVVSKLQSAKPGVVAQLLSVTGAPVDLFNLTTSTVTTVLGILGYNMLATNNGVAELNGQPFNNQSPYRTYRGSFNDILLNRGVARFSADPKALAAIAAQYQTSGKLSVPLITLHNTGDPIVPYWHETLYSQKLSPAAAKLHVNIPILSYGHCNFTSGEALFGFALLVLKSSGQQIPTTALSRALGPAAMTTFQNLQKQFAPANLTQ